MWIVKSLRSMLGYLILRLARSIRYTGLVRAKYSVLQNFVIEDFKIIRWLE